MPLKLAADSASGWARSSNCQAAHSVVVPGGHLDIIGEFVVCQVMQVSCYLMLRDSPVKLGLI
jgi:hypothetical protein